MIDHKVNAYNLREASSYKWESLGESEYFEPLRSCLRVASVECCNCFNISAIHFRINRFLFNLNADEVGL